MWISVLVITLYISFAMIASLRRRIRELEKQTKVDLVNIATFLSTPVLGLDAKQKIHDEDFFVSLDHMERAGSRLAAQTPALRRVMEVQMAMPLDYLRDRMGITANQLKGLVWGPV